MFHGEEYQEMLKQPITYNHHVQGISPERFYREPGITDMFEITSLSYGTDERAFVSSVEARDFETYPYMAVSSFTRTQKLAPKLFESTSRNIVMIVCIPSRFFTKCMHFLMESGPVASREERV